MPKYKYTEEMKQWLRDNVKGRSLTQLTEDFNNRFGTDVPESKIGHLKGDLKLRNGNDTKFQKGCVSNNKGKKLSQKQYEALKPTMFKKGQVPKNIRPVGSTRWDQGYIKEKVADGRWVGKNVVEWEKYHKRKVPQGHRVFFLDGNTTNFSPDNLFAATRSEFALTTTYKLRSNNPEVMKSGFNVAKLINQIKELQKL